VAAGADIADGVETERIFADVKRGQKLGHHLQHVDIEDEFLEGCR
jgi:hypothetical protein